MSIHHLSVAENFLDEELSSGSNARKILNSLTVEQYRELREHYILFEKNWEKSVHVSRDTIHMGRAFDTFKVPMSWFSEVRTKTLQRQLDPAQISNLLIYAPSLAIWIPPLSQENLVDALCHLADIRDYLVDGSVLIVPDDYYRDVCGWKDGYDNPSKLLRLSRAEATSPTLRERLEAIPRFPNDWDDLCSEDEFFRALRSVDSILYINPLNHLNEDIAVDAVIGCSTLCSSDVMREVLTRKYGAEAVRTAEATWNVVTRDLPRLHLPNAKDLLSVRRNEEAFHVWRTSLSDVIRAWEQQIESKGTISQREATMIFEERTLPARLALKNGLKSKSLASAIESGVVSFAAGAIAATAATLNPTAAILTGGLTSSIKLIYDVVASRRRKVNIDRAMLRMYSSFQGFN